MCANIAILYIECYITPSVFKQSLLVHPYMHVDLCIGNVQLSVSGSVLLFPLRPKLVYLTTKARYGYPSGMQIMKRGTTCTEPPYSLYSSINLLDVHIPIQFFMCSACSCYHSNICTMDCNGLATKFHYYYSSSHFKL